MTDMGTSTDQLNIAGAEIDTSSCSTATDTASVASRCAAHGDELDNSTSEFTEPVRVRKTIEGILKNLSETPLIETAREYVKDANERSVLVRKFSDRLVPMLNKASPLLSTALNKVDGLFDFSRHIICEIINKDYGFIATGNYYEIYTSFVTDSQTLAKDQYYKLKQVAENLLDSSIQSLQSATDRVLELKKRLLERFQDIFSMSNFLVIMHSISLEAPMANLNTVKESLKDFKGFIQMHFIQIPQDWISKEIRGLQSFQIQPIISKQTEGAKEKIEDLQRRIAMSISAAGQHLILVKDKAVAIAAIPFDRLGTYVAEIPEERRRQVVKFYETCLDWIKGPLDESRQGEGLLGSIKKSLKVNS